MRRIGVLMNGAATDTVYRSWLASFVEGLRQLGWTDGQNIHVDVRWNAADAGLARIYGAQLIGLMPDVIVASSTTNVTVIQQSTNTVPVVFLAVTDPVAQGFVASLSHPGSNITGFMNFEFSIGGKWLDLLKKAAPGLARTAVLFNPDTSPQSKFYMQAIESIAPSLGVKVFEMPVRTSADIEPAVSKFAQQPDGGLILTTDSFTRLNYPLIAELATRHRLPTVTWSPDFVKDGGLMAYTSNIDVGRQWYQAASYVDRILRGAQAGDLPVQNPVGFRLVINLKTAKALGLTIPETLLATADEVIQ
jgi:putative tryptophan/tyrosine transport system substrate-binding protein